MTIDPRCSASASRTSSIARRELTVTSSMVAPCFLMLLHPRQQVLRLGGASTGTGEQIDGYLSGGSDAYALAFDQAAFQHDAVGRFKQQRVGAGFGREKPPSACCLFRIRYVRHGHGG